MKEKTIQHSIFAAVREVGKGQGLCLPQEADAIDDVDLIGQVMMLLDRLCEREQEVPIGLVIAQQIPLLALGELGLMMRASEDLGAAYRRLVRFYRLQAPFVELTWEDTSHGAHLQVRYHLPKRPCSSVIIEGGLATLVCLGRMVTGTTWVPQGVCFPHRVSHPGLWEDYFQTSVTMGAVARISLSREVLSLQPIAPDAVVAQFIDQAAQSRLVEHPETRLLPALRQWLSGAMATSPSACDAARAIGMSRRTLHRHLSTAGSTYQVVLDEVRQEMADRRLHQGHPVSDVALALGYADTSSFCRAYRRWTGHSPKQFQLRHPLSS